MPGTTAGALATRVDDAGGGAATAGGATTGAATAGAGLGAATAGAGLGAGGCTGATEGKLRRSPPAQSDSASSNWEGRSSETARRSVGDKATNEPGDPLVAPEGATTEGAATEVSQASLRGSLDTVRKAVAATPNTSAPFGTREAYRDFGYAIKAAIENDAEAYDYPIVMYCGRQFAHQRYCFLPNGHGRRCCDISSRDIIALECDDFDGHVLMAQRTQLEAMS